MAVAKSPKFQEIVTRIKRGILLQQYLPGDTLPTEETLAKEYGVGRALIREALGILKAQGYIEARRGSSGGTFVCDLIQSKGFSTLLADLITMRSMSIRHVCDVRLLIEPEVARLAALEASSMELKQLGDFVFSGTEAKTVRERINFDVAFHNKLSELSGNPFFSLLMRSMMGFLQEFIHVLDDYSRYTHDESVHTVLYNAIRNRDHQGAYEAMFVHVADMKQRFCLLENAYLSIQAANLKE